MSSVWLIKTIWSPQTTWTEILDFSSANISANTVKSRVLFSIFRFKLSFPRIYHKRSDKFSPFLKNPGRNSKALVAIPKSWEQLQNPERSHPSLTEVTEAWVGWNILKTEFIYRTQGSQHEENTDYILLYYCKNDDCGICKCRFYSILLLVLTFILWI